MVSAFGQPEFTVTIIAMWCHVVWNPASHLTEGKRKNSSNTAARKASWKKRTRSRWLLLAYRESTRGEHITHLWKLWDLPTLQKDPPHICLDIPQSLSYQQVPSWLLKGSRHCDQSQNLLYHCHLTPSNTSKEKAKALPSSPSSSLTLIVHYVPGTVSKYITCRNLFNSWQSYKCILLLSPLLHKEIKPQREFKSW